MIVAGASQYWLRLGNVQSRKIPAHFTPAIP